MILWHKRPTDAAIPSKKKDKLARYQEICGLGDLPEPSIPHLPIPLPDGVNNNNEASEPPPLPPPLEDHISELPPPPIVDDGGPTYHDDSLPSSLQPDDKSLQLQLLLQSFLQNDDDSIDSVFEMALGTDV
jgi:hypothetical protein